MIHSRTPLEPKTSTLSVLMPVYNERDTIEAIVAQVLAAPIAPIRLELVVVDDGSSDGSRDVLQRLHRDGRIHKLHLQPENRGKGAAIRQALGLSTGEIVIVQDADLEYDPADWPVRFSTEKQTPALDHASLAVRTACCSSGTPWETSC